SAGIDSAMIDDWITVHGLAKASEMVGDQLPHKAGLEPAEALAKMKADPTGFYEEHGALLASAVLRRGLSQQQADQAAKGVVAGTDASLVHFADAMGFSMITHVAPESRANAMLGSGTLIPGRDSGGLIWAGEKYQTDRSTFAQRASMADYGNRVTEALPMAIPKDFVIPPTHAYETKNLPEYLNKKAYLLKGKMQMSLGNAAGLPPVAIDGPIHLLPKGVGLTAGEVDAMREQIAGSIHTKSGQNAKIAFIVVAGTGVMARFIALYWPEAEREEEDEKTKNPGPG
ncbi:MAG: hypothetical protein ACI9WU_001184, partial [Myxococcota bacterium]